MSQGVAGSFLRQRILEWVNIEKGLPTGRPLLKTKETEKTITLATTTRRKPRKPHTVTFMPTALVIVTNTF
jgi:hypothetical protein